MSTVFQQDHILGRGWILRSSLTLYMCEPFFTKIPKRSAHDILNDIFKRLGPKESPWKSNHSNLFSPLSSKERIHIAWSKIFKVLYVTAHTQCLGENDENSSKMFRSSQNFACNLSWVEATAEMTGSSVPPTIFLFQHFQKKSGKVLSLYVWLTGCPKRSRTVFFDHLLNPQT
jgi:hypothetical protein